MQILKTQKKELLKPTCQSYEYNTHFHWTSATQNVGLRVALSQVFFESPGLIVHAFLSS